MVGFSRHLLVALAFGVFFTPASPGVAKPAQPAVTSQKPLLVIRFNQENVHFNRALRQAVANAEQAKQGVVYRVVSTVPVNRKGVSSVTSEQAKKRVAAVTAAMDQLGVSSDRIKTSSDTSRSAQSQEIRIYVE